MDPTASENLSLQVDQAFLLEMVQQALDLPNARLMKWECLPIHGGFEIYSQIIRCQGMAEDAGEKHHWSVILKILHPNERNSDPNGAHYWKREILAYQSPVLKNLPGKVKAPRCYGVQEQPDGSNWVWLDDVHDDVGQWTLENYNLAARHFGQFNGAYLTGIPLPDEPWITHNWSRIDVDRSAPMVDFMLANPDQPQLRDLLPPDKRAQILAFWELRHKLMDRMDEVPQTFCHMDAFKRNLFARGDETVAIDWAFSGIAPLGTELHSMVGGSLAFYEFPMSRAFELDRACFEGYLQGLRDAGIKARSREVRMCYTIGIMYRFVIGSILADLMPILLAGGQEHVDQAFGEKKDEAGKADPHIVAYYQSIVYEAFRLMGIGNLARLLGQIARYTIKLKRTASA